MIYKLLRFTAFSIICALMFTSCKSGVSLKQVQVQEAKAESALQNAKNEMLELIKVKEQYSEDSRDQRIKDLEDRVAKIDRDIKRLEGVEEKNNETVSSGVGSAVTSLKNDRADLQIQLESIQSIKRENWTSSVEIIHQHITRLEEEINMITANLPPGE